LLYGKAPVGSDFFEMLSDLQKVIETFFELNEPNDRWDQLRAVKDYMVERNLCDVRGNIQAALGLLAWCEQPQVRWDEVYSETFVHCVGMMINSTLSSPEFKILSRVSRHNLESAYNGLQLKILDAEERLETFDFSELFGVGSASSSPAMKASEAFREFLVSFYRRKYRAWPPSSDSDRRWLSRSIVQRLQTDFGAVYDFLVDRDIVWDPTEERHTRKWEMISTKHRPDGVFNADSHGVPLTDMLVSFDYKHNYKHIPHPFPLLPWSPKQARQPEETKRTKPSFLSNLKKSKPAPTAPVRDLKEQHQLSLALNGATNINKLDASLDLENPILDALIEHEKALHLSPSSVSLISPADARLGRWILLYGILQTLATVSVDIEGLRYTEGCAYMLSCELEGCPPWRVPGRDAEGTEWASHGFGEAKQERSYCWLAPSRWGRGRGGGEVVGGGGDGRAVRAARHSTEPAQYHHRPRNTDPQARRSTDGAGYAALAQHQLYHGYSTSTTNANPVAPVAAPGFAPEDLIDEVSELDGRSIVRSENKRRGGGGMASPTSPLLRQQQYRNFMVGGEKEVKEKGYFYGQSPNIVMFPPTEEKSLGKGGGVLGPEVPARSARRKGMIGVGNGFGFEEGGVGSLGG